MDARERTLYMATFGVVAAGLMLLRLRRKRQERRMRALQQRNRRLVALVAAQKSPTPEPRSPRRTGLGGRGGGAAGGRRRRLWTRVRSDNFWQHVISNDFSAQDWLHNFHLSRATFEHACDLLRDHIATHDTAWRPATPVEKKVAVFLWRLSNNCHYKVLSQLFGVGRSSACLILKEAIQGHHTARHAARDQAVREHAQLLRRSLRTSRSWSVGTARSQQPGLARRPTARAGWRTGHSYLNLLLQNRTHHRLRPTPGRLVLSHTSWRTPSFPLRPEVLKPYDFAATKPQRTYNSALNGAIGYASQTVLKLKARWKCLAAKYEGGPEQRGRLGVGLLRLTATHPASCQLSMVSDELLNKARIKRDALAIKLATRDV
ncbi:hypothetical protein MTO96_037418 [Rhipicephalus appendiculatus]